MYLGWDIGIKNLAYCLMDYDENTQKTKIIDWGIINLVLNHKNPSIQCCGIVKSTNKQCVKCSVKVLKSDKTIGYCKAHAKTIKEELVDFNCNIQCSICDKDASRFDPSTNIYYCTRHVPKELKEKVDKISNKATKIPLIQLGKTLFTELDKYNQFKQAEYIIIENQPVLKNPTMKSVQMMLYSYFLKSNIVDLDNPKLKDILLMSAKNKLKLYDGESNEEIKKIGNIKSQYTRNKKLAIVHTNYYLNNEDKKWFDLFKNSNKKDDLCDAYLMTKYFIYKKFKLI